MKVKRAALTITLGLGLLVTPVAADAQPAPRVPRMGLLLFRGAAFQPESDPYDRAFAQGLREHGYVVGQNLLVEVRSAEGKLDRLPEAAVELVQLGVDLIVAPGTVHTRAAKQATTTIPIVMVAPGDPVGSGFVGSLARPGGNVTGLSLNATELSAKRLQLLKEAVPTVSRVAVLWDTTDRAMQRRFEEIKAAAPKLGMTLQPQPLQTPDDFDAAFAAVTRGRSDALLIVTNPLTERNRARILEFSVKQRLPNLHELRGSVEAGGLLSYGPSELDNFRRAAGYVAKILRGARPADLPVEEPTKYELVVNLKAARVLGLTIPQSFLLLADEVIP